MNEQEKALQAEGAAKPAQPAAKIYVIDSRERLLVPLTFGFCLLLVNTLLTCGSGLGWASAVCAWYVLVAVCKGWRLTATGESRFLLGTNLALALVSLALGSNGFFRVWNTLALMALLPIHAIGLSGGQFLPWWRPAMLWERFRLLLAGLFGRLGAVTAALLPRQPGGSRRVLPLAAGTVGALALLGVLVPVLASADALFAAATADLRAFVKEHFTSTLWKLIWALILAPFVFSLLYFLRRPTPLSPSRERPERTVDGLAFAVMLAAIVVLYALFLAVQSAGLFGGEAYLASRGLSYAQWARSGFFQMVGVTVVNLTVLLVSVSFSRRDGRCFTVVRLLGAALTAQSVLLLASAAWRMTLYVSAYGLSFKRVMTYWGMVMMALFFLAAAWKLAKPDFCFFRAAVPVALAGWLVINCVPADYLVARDQVDRYLSGETASMDVEYLLYDLSYDTLSQLNRLDKGQLVQVPAGQFTLDYLLDLERQEAREVCADWRSWNLSACLAAMGR